MKDIKNWGVMGVFTGLIASKILKSYFGVNGQIAILFGAIIILIFIIIYLIIKKNYKGACAFIVLTIPGVMIALGMYYSKIRLVGIGLLLYIILSITGKSLIEKIGAKK